MSRECLSFVDNRRNMAWGDAPDGFTLEARQLYDETRWGVLYINVYKRQSDGKLFAGISELPSGDGEVIDDGLADTYCEADWIPSKTYYIKEK